MKQIIMDNKLYVIAIVCVGVLLSLVLNCYITGVNNQVIHPIWLLTHTSKKWILIWTIIFICAGMLVKFTKITEYLHRFRYIIGCSLLLICVCLNINGSSIGNWATVINDGSQTDNGNIVGISRPIRSDEWNVFTPLALSQEYNDYGYTSEIPRATETDMFIVYGQPVKDVSIIFRPFQIGYLVLGSSYGLSFYWMSRLIFLFLFSYDFILLITKNKKLLAVMGASMITFAPAIQWWFSVNGYVEMIIAIEVSVLLFSKYMQCDKLWVRMLCSSGIMICAGMYILTLYPPVMIPLAYVLLGLIAWVFFKNIKQCKYRWRDFWCTLGIVSVFGLLLIRIFYMSFDTILAVINTSYPGSREYAGGGCTLSTYTDSIFNILLPFGEKFAFTNQCEDARFIDLFPLSYVFVIAILLLKQKGGELNLLIKIMLPINLILLIISLCPMPYALMKFTLLTKSSLRITFATQFSNIVIMFSAISQLIAINKKNISCSLIIIVATFIGIGISAFAFMLKINNAVTLGISYTNIKQGLIVCSLILCALVALCVLMIKSPKSSILSGITFICIMVIAGGLVNPIRQGINVIKEQNLSKEIQQIVASDKDSKWIVNGNMGANFLIANGAKTINSINVYPYLDRWKKLDFEENNVDIYNRYAHITAEYISGQPYNDKFELLYADQFKFYFDKNDLNTMGVNYILCPASISDPFFADNNFSIKYKDEQFYIFQYINCP